MNKIEEFKQEVKDNIKNIAADAEFQNTTLEWMKQSVRNKYSYNFSWMGRPIIQYPQDIVAMQELIFKIQPDLIIETGIAHGGSLIFYASMLELLGNPDSKVLGIDIDIREHNKLEIEKHKMYHKIVMLEGSSIDQLIVSKVHDYAKNFNKILVVLDSCHSHTHVLEECRAYSELVKAESYLVVFDTVTEYVADEIPIASPWGKGDNPKTAVDAFLKENDRFVIDKEIENKLGITVAPSGYLKCTK